MKRLNNLSLTQRLVLIVMVPVTCVSLVTSALYLNYVREPLELATRARAQSIASFLAPAAEFGVFSGNAAHLDKLLQAAMAQDGVVAVAILDARGAPIAQRGQPMLLAHAVFASGDGTDTRRVGAQADRLAVSARVVSPRLGIDAPAEATEPIGWAYVEFDASDLEQQRATTLLQAMLLAAMALLLAGIPAYRLARRVGRLVARLAEAVHCLAAGQLDVKVPEAARERELGALERGFNAMAHSMSSAQQELNRQMDRATAHLNYLALHDPLTGLLNRRAFDGEITKAVMASRRTADHGTLCFVDLDHFKAINDACGHAAGDAVLQAVSVRLGGCVRAEDMIFRIGGDEFAIILKGCSPDDARRIAEGLCKAIAAYRFTDGGRHFDLGASIGLARIDNPDISADALVAAADAACYQAKRDGRNRVMEV
ncbi:GGDEF domain-containing protein [Denitromonas iodatirespirans]|uniref:diguanylate cyclase n=1 Tax=Denitromonas iodatirespirans TaxID=2795389 RepID=A0A944H7Q7_DENI1|nr:GGDEF domain-containing protein [Denitromonas iodatirespirans]MBT0961493.1 diguanylate cyclase [Denitromonas iodatirespirans]